MRRRTFRPASALSGQPTHAVAALLVALLVLISPAPVSAQHVSQAEWARLLVGAMGLGDEIAEGEPVTGDFIDFLSGETMPAQTIWASSSHPYPQGANRLPNPADEDQPWLQAGAAPVTASYIARASHPGIYALRFRGHGGDQRWRVGKGSPRIARPGPDRNFPGAGKNDRMDLLGYFVLPRGEHKVTVEIPAGGGLLCFELLRQPFPHVRPPGGWRPGAPLTFGAKAVTMIQAMELEHELPDVSRWRVEREGERYDEERRPASRKDSSGGSKPSAGAWLKGAARGSRVVYLLPVMRGGTYSLLARITGKGSGSILLNDLVERRWQGSRPADALVWRNLATLPLDEGTQQLDVALAPDAGLDVMRLVYRDPSPEASLMLLEDLGFEESAPEDLVSKLAAKNNLENGEFRDRLKTLLESFYTQPGGGIGPLPGFSPIPPPGLVITDPGDITPTDTPPKISP